VTILALAIQQGEWSFVALCLLLGVSEAASRLPPDSLDALLELLEEPARRG
jgi:hypothetical protein